MRCYNAALSVVKRDGMSWDVLVDRGLAMKAKIKRGPFGDAFDVIIAAQAASQEERALWAGPEPAKPCRDPGEPDHLFAARLRFAAGQVEGIMCGTDNPAKQGLYETDASYIDRIARGESPVEQKARVSAGPENSNYAQARVSAGPEPAAPPCDPDLDGEEIPLDPLRPVDEIEQLDTATHDEAPLAFSPAELAEVAAEPADPLRPYIGGYRNPDGSVEPAPPAVPLDPQPVPKRRPGASDSAYACDLRAVFGCQEGIGTDVTSPNTQFYTEPDADYVARISSGRLAAAKPQRGRKETAEEILETTPDKCDKTDDPSPETKMPWEVV
jgi:hypothetical protein